MLLAENNTNYFYFEAFDEPWKEIYGGVETHWGLVSALSVALYRHSTGRADLILTPGFGSSFAVQREQDAQSGSQDSRLPT